MRLRREPLESAEEGGSQMKNKPSSYSVFDVCKWHLEMRQGAEVTIHKGTLGLGLSYSTTQRIYTKYK